MKVLVTLKDGSKKHVTDLKKIVYPGYERIETVTKDEIETFFLDPTRAYVFVGAQTLSVEAGQILTVEFS
ncbi:hypothetical protein ACB385_001143 [Staphylococcus pseudintermedius]|uniref:hypothetical protein n=1 Tax=Staphylococcus pseudintermedius TaxID=283734 RepID=UPI00090AC0BC|nr:hypothetical protein [Staphylococcus pseudintermedius]APD19962.1 hypothetical protein SpT99F3_013 [Staphylococcus phage SpT99F3]EGQ1615944.1 hypothetical protein [Staphylococcus pseudintermedius]EGQ1623661.1 hypothetical protein [Staphylococcus pseudintermedius]EGQ1646856.1 hypothetical protein [Staphylococcus pseudintermedius]EGQ1724407.1 hypothetical protein [Staphylococcus pseudintermedius]